MATILIIENDEGMCEVAFSHLSSNGFDVLKASNFKGALKIIHSKKVDLILMDWSIPGRVQPNDFLEAVSKLHGDIPPILICTAKLKTHESLDVKYHEKIKSILIKPIEVDELQNQINKILNPRAK